LHSGNTPFSSKRPRERTKKAATNTYLTELRSEHGSRRAGFSLQEKQMQFFEFTKVTHIALSKGSLTSRVIHVCKSSVMKTHFIDEFYLSFY